MKWTFLPLEVVPAGLGIFLMLLTFVMRAPRIEQR